VVNYDIPDYDLLVGIPVGQIGRMINYTKPYFGVHYHMATSIETFNLTKRFKDLIAVDNLNLRIDQGEIIGLIGPNGAGKTTLFNLLSGTYRPSSGKIIFLDEDITNLKPYEICWKGIARTFQLLKPFSNTIFKNHYA
jgi:branched-chain amino acid transport system ATP-binding protein